MNVRSGEDLLEFLDTVDQAHARGLIDAETAKRYSYEARTRIYTLNFIWRSEPKKIASDILKEQLHTILEQIEDEPDD